jgi:hypothetical protein
VFEKLIGTVMVVFVFKFIPVAKKQATLDPAGEREIESGRIGRPTTLAPRLAS